MYTSFTQLYFQKPIEQIDEDDLIGFFSNEQEETLMLEFKSFTQPPAGAPRISMKDREEAIFKTLCAFANSGGGLLIWGAPKEEKSLTNPKTTVCKGALQPVPDYLDRDSYIRKIASNIDPRPQGLRMHRVQVSGGYVYLFEIQESQNKPHQTKGTYYVRIETETNIAPHYLVYALCRQIKVPELVISLVPHNGVRTIRHGELYEVDLIFQFKNITQFINETEVYLKLSTTNGAFRLSDGSRYENVLFKEDVIKTLPFGIEHYLKITLELNVLIYDVFINAWFGGKLSTAKYQAYKLKLAGDYFDRRVQLEELTDIEGIFDPPKD